MTAPWTPPKSSAYSDEAACFTRLLDMVNVQIVARFTIDGDPASKARARFTKRGSRIHAYTPEKTKTAEQRVAWLFKKAAPQHVPDSQTAYGLACVFFPATQQRRDVDNMLKLISDGLNGVAWDDDSQVYEVTGRRGQDLPANARTEVLIYTVGEVHKRRQECPHCGTLFEVFNSIKRVYCSRDCSYAARRKERVCKHCGSVVVDKASREGRLFCDIECQKAHGRVEARCEICGDRFTTYRSWQRTRDYCSKVECRRAIDNQRARERRTKSFPGKCLICGGGTTRKEYKRCSACRRKPLPEVTA